MKSLFSLAKSNFMGHSPEWYKITIVVFLVMNPLIYYFVNPFVAGWVVLAQFIFTLACALKCYPLQPGGLIAIQSIIIGLTSTDTVFAEVMNNIPTVLLLIFMIAGIYFIKDILFLMVTKLFLTIEKKHLLSLAFCGICACLAAFLGLITLAAISVAVSFNFYSIYYKATLDGRDDASDFEEFRGFLRNLMVHGAVGSTIGGTMTIVGEPQNFMIATKMGWSFSEFFTHNHVISLPVAISAFVLCFLLEYFKFPGFGYEMSAKVRSLIIKDYEKKIHEMTLQNVHVYIVQIIAGILLVFSLAFSVAQVGLIGLGLIVIVTTFTGLTREHDLAEAFNNAMPFTMLIIAFFVILGVVHDQHLVSPIAAWVFTFSGQAQLMSLYFTNGLLSLVSDNVFVASVFISEVDNAFAAGMFSREWYEKLAVVVNMGTNIPAIATPNGQAGFLFILTSSLAPLIKLSYFQMFKLVLPYTIVMTSIGALAVYFIL